MTWQGWGTLWPLTWLIQLSEPGHCYCVQRIVFNGTGVQVNIWKCLHLGIRNVRITEAEEGQQKSLRMMTTSSHHPRALQTWQSSACLPPSPLVSLLLPLWVSLFLLPLLLLIPPRDFSSCLSFPFFLPLCFLFKSAYHEAKTYFNCNCFIK